MDKLEIWKKNEPLFHTKLNDSVNAINALIESNNKLENQINGSGNSGTLPDFYEYKEQIAEMFSNDGEGITLAGNVTYFVGEAGLYARENGAATIGKKYYPESPCLKKIIDYSCLNDGGILYQKIQDHNGKLTSTLHYATDSACVPAPTNTTIYKRLSRIALDCKAFQCTGRPIYKAIAVNDTLFNLGSGGSSAAKCYDLYAPYCYYGNRNFLGVNKSSNGIKTTFDIYSLLDFDCEFFTLEYKNNGRIHVSLRNVPDIPDCVIC